MFLLLLVQVVVVVVLLQVGGASEIGTYLEAGNAPLVAVYVQVLGRMLEVEERIVGSGTCAETGSMRLKKLGQFLVCLRCDSM